MRVCVCISVGMCVCVMGLGLVYELRCAWVSVRDTGRVPAVVTHLAPGRVCEAGRRPDLIPAAARRFHPWCGEPQTDASAPRGSTRVGSGADGGAVSRLDVSVGLAEPGALSLAGASGGVSQPRCVSLFSCDRCRLAPGCVGTVGTGRGLTVSPVAPVSPLVTRPPTVQYLRGHSGLKRRRGPNLVMKMTGIDTGVVMRWRL